MEESENVLILGVGNVLLADEGIGIAALRRLGEKHSWPGNVRLLDGGTGGHCLMPEIMECDFLLALDAALGPGKPGSFYLLDGADLGHALGFRASLHQSSLADLLCMCRLAGRCPTAQVLGFEPFDMSGPALGPTAKALALLPAYCDRALELLAQRGIKPLA